MLDTYVIFYYSHNKLLLLLLFSYRQIKQNYQCRRLRLLYLGGNQLTTLPQEIGDLLHMQVSFSIQIAFLSCHVFKIEYFRGVLLWQEEFLKLKAFPKMCAVVITRIFPLLWEEDFLKLKTIPKCVPFLRDFRRKLDNFVLPFLRKFRRLFLGLWLFL